MLRGPNGRVQKNSLWEGEGKKAINANWGEMKSIFKRKRRGVERTGEHFP